MEEKGRLEINVFVGIKALHQFLCFGMHSKHIYVASQVKQRRAVRADLMNTIQNLETLNKQQVLSETTRQLKKAYLNLNLI